MVFNFHFINESVLQKSSPETNDLPEEDADSDSDSDEKMDVNLASPPPIQALAFETDVDIDSKIWYQWIW